MENHCPQPGASKSSAGVSSSAAIHAAVQKNSVSSNNLDSGGCSLNVWNTAPACSSHCEFDSGVVSTEFPSLARGSRGA